MMLLTFAMYAYGFVVVVVVVWLLNISTNENYSVNLSDFVLVSTVFGAEV